MRRMIAENQQEALKKLTSKEALLGLTDLGSNYGIASMGVAIDSDGYTYVIISGQAQLTEGDGSEYFTVVNIPVDMGSAGSYLATNNNGGGGRVGVSISGTTATVTFDAGDVNRVVYFSILLSKRTLDI